MSIFLSVGSTLFFTSCTPEALSVTETVATEGEDGEVEGDDDDGGSN